MEKRALLVGVVLAAVLAPVLGSAEAPAAQVGAWSAPFWEGGAAPYDGREASAAAPAAVSVVVLPDGRILYWNAIEGVEDAEDLPDYFTQHRNARARILDLSGAEPRWTVPTPERGTNTGEDTDDMWCADQRLLYDGTVVIAGGHEYRTDHDLAGIRRLSDTYGDDQTRIFDPATDSFRDVEQMSRPRWYPTTVTLPDGGVLVLSGYDNFVAPEPDADNNMIREVQVYDPATESWSDRATLPHSLPVYPRVTLLPNGKVFYSGSGNTFGYTEPSADSPLHGMRLVYDPEADTWEQAGVARYGTRGQTMQTLLRLEAPYDTARILMAGGTLGSEPGTQVATTLSEIVEVLGDTIRSLDPIKQPFDGLAGDASQLRNPRWFGSPVLLPTGEVLAFNGADHEGILTSGTEIPERMAELYDPETNTWRELSEATRGRTYHSSAVLLGDGRVLVGGHAPIPNYWLAQNPPSVTGRNGFRDPTFEIFSPPYLFRGPRPVIASAGAAEAGRAVRVTLGAGTTAADVSELVLVRHSAVTHAFDPDQRAVVLEHQVRADGSLIASLPAASVLPPGPYFVFAMRDTADGPTPSISKTVMIRPDGAGGVIVA